MKNSGGLAKEPVACVVKAVGALICLRIEQEWAASTPARAGSPWDQFINELDPGAEGKNTKKNWKRWRDMKERAPFASGNQTTIRLVLRAAARKGMLPRDLAIRTRIFFSRLEQIGDASINIERDQRFDFLGKSDGLIFELACLDFGSQAGRLIDLTTGVELNRSKARANLIASPKERRALTLATAFVALHSVRKMGRTLRRSSALFEGSIASGLKADNGSAPDRSALALAQESLMYEGEGLVDRLYVLMQSVYGRPANGFPANASERTKFAGLTLLRRIRRKLDEL